MDDMRSFNKDQLQFYMTIANFNRVFKKQEVVTPFANIRQNVKFESSENHFITHARSSP
jgi:hypothetical protein